MLILGIETSCDETGVALFDSDKGLIGECLYSQVSMHADYGGVVPELASRDHVRKLILLIDSLLKNCDKSLLDLDAIAYTQGPGLAGALLVGSMTAKTLALSRAIPAIGIHHMEGHLLASMLDENPPEFPFVALLVSGGHSQLVLATALGSYKLLGESLDDAAGEAFDKAAKMLGLSYPGGPAIAQQAELFRNSYKQNAKEVLVFPRPMTNRPGLDFSFSGLKTFTLNSIAEHSADGELSKAVKANIAHGFEEAVVQTIAIKCARALKQTQTQRLVLAGGVAANKRLREYLPTYLDNQLDVVASIHYPAMKYCTDNGAMIAYAGYLRLSSGLMPDSDWAVNIKPRWSMTELKAL